MVCCDSLLTIPPMSSWHCFGLRSLKSLPSLCFDWKATKHQHWHSSPELFWSRALEKTERDLRYQHHIKEKCFHLFICPWISGFTCHVFMCMAGQVRGLNLPQEHGQVFQHQQQGLVGQIMKHEVEVSGCSGADNYSPMTNSFVIHLTQVPPQLGWLYKWEWALDWYVNLNNCIARKGKCFDCLSTIGLWREDGQLVKSSNIALDKEWPQKTFIWPHAPLNNNVV